MITNYRFIYDRPEPPIYNFITRSYEHKNYKLCYEACKFVLSSVLLEKCILDNDYMKQLLYYFVHSREELKM